MCEAGSEIEYDWAEKDGREKRGDSEGGGRWRSAAAEACKRGLRRTATGRGVVTEGAGAGGNDGRGAAGRRRVRGARVARGTGSSGKCKSGVVITSGVVGGKTGLGGVGWSTNHLATSETAER